VVWLLAFPAAIQGFCQGMIPCSISLIILLVISA
jgi:ABC-type nickel/cobalt efflux system permease component RcnA